MFNGLFSNLGRPVSEGQTILDFPKARDDGVAVASAEPYADLLHLAPDQWWIQGGEWGMHPPPARIILPFEKVETRVRTIGLSVLFQPPVDDADR